MVNHNTGVTVKSGECLRGFHHRVTRRRKENGHDTNRSAAAPSSRWSPSAPPAITAQKQAINDLNVFPVPDGDTGTNMTLTIQHGGRPSCRKAEPATVDEAAKLTASGPAPGCPGQLRRHPVPAVPRHEQGPQGP